MDAVDFVIEFNVAPRRSLSKVKDQETKATEYNALLSSLAAAGFKTTSRKGSGETLLIFVRLDDDRLSAEVHKERTDDFLAGVSSSPPSDASPKLSPADRLRLVHSILTSPSGVLPAGPSVGIHGDKFPSVKGVFALQDEEWTKKWLHAWNSKVQVTEDQIEEVRTIYGEAVALYFAFLQHYFQSLALPAILGLSCHFLLTPFSSFYSLVLVAWSLIFVESWRVKEKRLAIRWGVEGSEKTEHKRPEYDGRGWAAIAQRQAAGVLGGVAFAGVLLGLITTIYTIETLIGETYTGPGKQYLSLLPTVLFVGLVPRVTGLWGQLSDSLTGWENHPTPSSHEWSITLKVFVMNCVVAFGSLTLTSFIYIPFGAVLVPYVLGLLPSHHSLSSKKEGVVNDAKAFLTPGKDSPYAVNSGRLHAQVVAYTLTGQIIGAFTEIGLPFLLSFGKKQLAGTGKVGEKKAKDAEEKWLDGVREQQDRPEYELFGDYAEMATQFGYVVLWSTIWPLAPVAGFVNNFFELRGDAFKLARQSRRPVPVRTSSIGPWLEVLGFLSWVGAVTNAALVYLYTPHSDTTWSETLFDETVHNGTASAFATSNLHHASLQTHLGDTKALGSIKRTMLTALLIGLASEQAYLLVRGVVRYVVQKTWWEGSEESHQKEDRRRALRAQFVDSKAEVPAVNLKSLANKVEADGESFWSKAKDVGLSSVGKTE